MRYSAHVLYLFKYCSSITHAARHIAPIPVTRDVIIGELYNSREVTAALRKMEPADLREDLKQEIFIVLCEMAEDRLRGLYERKELRYFLTGVIWRMATNSRSEFYMTHRYYREKLLSGNIYVHPAGHFAISADEEGEAQHADATKQYTDNLAPEYCVFEKLDKALAELDPYEAGLIRLYAEMGQNCAQVARETQIPVRSVGLAISQAKTKLKADLRSHA